MTKKKNKPWKKNLYENLGYEDNYTDPSFLKDLQKNKNVKYIRLQEAIFGATKLTQQISSIVLFLIIFYFMYINYISPQIILLYSLICMIVGYILYNTFYYITNKNSIDNNNYDDNNNNKHRIINSKIIFDDSKMVLSVLFFGYILSPLLHSLTNSISSDTIFKTTFFVMLLHIIFFDYGVTAAYMVSKAISLNSAIFGSICLASRLATSFHAFTLLVVSAEFFALLPIVLKMCNTSIFIFPLGMLCSYFLYKISISLLITYVIIIIFINIICPIIFVVTQKYKNNIHGPWDEAIVKDLDLNSNINI